MDQVWIQDLIMYVLRLVLYADTESSSNFNYFYSKIINCSFKTDFKTQRIFLNYYYFFMNK